MSHTFQILFHQCWLSPARGSVRDYFSTEIQLTDYILCLLPKSHFYNICMRKLIWYCLLTVFYEMHNTYNPINVVAMET